MKTMDELMEPVKNVGGFYLKPCTDEPLIELSQEGYVDILGHRIDGKFDSFKSFVEYLKQVSDIERENEELKKQLKLAKKQEAAFEDWLKSRIAVYKLDRDYTHHLTPGGYPNLREVIFQEVFDYYMLRKESINKD